MNCPACSRSLTALAVGGVIVDVCEGGCGGIWFEKGELQQFDEQAERADPLLRVHRDPKVVPDSCRHACPSCETVVMSRHDFTTRFEIEVDECPGCGGFWLDHGELEAIRDQFTSEQDRADANEAFLSENLALELGELVGDSGQHERSSLLARLFCWALPGLSFGAHQPRD